MTGTRASADAMNELYPFLAPVTAPPSPDALEDVLAAVRDSTRQKAADVVALRRALLASHREDIARAGVTLAAAVRAGGKLLAFGNGGSATDAMDAVADCTSPPHGSAQIPALALTADVGIVTAVANDVGFEHVFARQVIAYGERGDVAVAFSTSGGSPSVVRGLQEARRRGLFTIAFAGYDGGAVARAAAADVCIVARSDHVPRVQEGHATAWHALLRVTWATLAAERGTGGNTP